MNATLAYAPDCSGRVPFKGIVITSNVIGLSLMLAPAVWFRVASVLGRALSCNVINDHVTSVLVPHIIAVPSEVMLVLASVGAALAYLASRQAKALIRTEGISSTRWSLGIRFGLLCNSAAIAANLLTLLQL